MRYLPVFLDMHGARIVVAGSGPAAVAKLRLLLKTPAAIEVFDAEPGDDVLAWEAGGALTLHRRPLAEGDADGAKAIYLADGSADPATRAAVEAARANGILVNVVDAPEECDFLTPAVVDRDPVIVAIGSEGTAPMLATRLRAEIEDMLPAETGPLARIAGSLRRRAHAVPAGARRRAFWARFFGAAGATAWRSGGHDAVVGAFEGLLAEETAPVTGRVALVGAGPGDPELLTRKAHRLLREADVIVYDRLVSPVVLDLARRDARFLPVGKMPFGPSWKQEDINALIVAEAQAGNVVVRLKSGDPGIYGRLDEEVEALDAAGVAFEVVPGITAAVAGAAELGLSLTRRGRNKSLRFLTGHDIDGFAEHDWRGLAAPGATAAVYMGVRAARFIQGRLLMHGADPATPVTVVENISRGDRREAVATLAELPETMAAAGIVGPAILYLGIAPRGARSNAARPEPSQRNPAHAQSR